MKTFNTYELVKKLIGPIKGVGETNADADRLRNLEETIQLTDRLLFNISNVANDRYRTEWSLQALGKRAHKFLVDTGLEELDEDCEEEKTPC